MTITISGVLHRVEKRSEGPDGHPVVVLTVWGATEGVAVEFKVRRATHADAEALAGRLERGAVAAVSALGMRYRTDHGDPTFVLYKIGAATVGGEAL